MWAHENDYDAVIAPIARAHAVPLELVKGLIGQESQFNPNAYRFEPLSPTTTADDDASRGLMQVLYATARGEGYTGTATGLFEVAPNIEFGVRYLRRQLDRSRGDVAAAISAYNGGYRPDLAFGARATKPLTICLRRDAAGKCAEYRNVAVGEFANQPYVDSVLTNVRYFAVQHARSLQDVEEEAAVAASASGGVVTVIVGLLLATLLALFLLVKGH